jgi:glycosyltransferase involved in cell wall biosynthesis
VLEARAAGCPVIKSDIRGIQEQVGNAGLLVDPLDVQAIATAMWHIYTQPELSKELVHKGTERVNAWTPQQFGRRLAEIIQDTANQ